MAIYERVVVCCVCVWMCACECLCFRCGSIAVKATVKQTDARTDRHKDEQTDGQTVVRCDSLNVLFAMYRFNYLCLFYYLHFFSCIVSSSSLFVICCCRIYIISDRTLPYDSFVGSVQQSARPVKRNRFIYVSIY